MHFSDRDPMITIECTVPLAERCIDDLSAEQCKNYLTKKLLVEEGGQYEKTNLPVAKTLELEAQCVTLILLVVQYALQFLPYVLMELCYGLHVEGEEQLRSNHVGNRIWTYGFFLHQLQYRYLVGRV